MNDDLGDLYQQVILDHNKSPRNFRKIEPADRTAEGYNPLCGDQVKVFLKLDGDVISDVSFQGSGCAISKASASMMTSSLKGKTTAEAKQLFEHVHQSITTGSSDTEKLGKLAVFAGVHNFPSRIKCAILPWHAVVAAIEGKTEPVTTDKD
ncbi:MAG: SUF system NifU family Fe-S cluster assembly protein [Verrucomicrobiae bacterium]|nr:SUF system NifU family Fe-S cluster assembly protein [Verrucomicrobiae bacterium]